MQLNKRIGYLGGEEGDGWWDEGLTLTGKGTTREHLDSGMKEGLQPLAMPPSNAPESQSSILPSAHASHLPSLPARLPSHAQMPASINSP